MDMWEKLMKKVINREVILYGVFGVGTSVLNIGLYAYLVQSGMDYMVANIITLIVVKLTAYIVNKLFVFQSKTENLIELAKEFFRFVVTRGITMIVDFVGLILLVEMLHIDDMIGKVCMTVFVVILNYFFGKLHVFKKKDNTEEEV